ncbi:MAG: PfkB family carbohydrate kinase, partial [Succinatimonas sp.]|nr:PfkB family carbohydrate kinase [Succinatimonas sp.]
ILQNEVNELEYLIKRGSELGFKIAFNVSPFSEELLDLPLKKCAWLLVNEVEAAGIARMTPDAPASSLLQGISSKLPDCNIVLTLGTRGSVYKQADGKLFAFGCYKVKALDTTGSGDTYTGFLLQALASGKRVPEAMKLASCAAAISVTRMGAASSVPDLNEVLSSELYQGDDPKAPLL